MLFVSVYNENGEKDFHIFRVEISLIILWIDPASAIKTQQFHGFQISEKEVHGPTISKLECYSISLFRF
jgi:hypothetical protein